MKSKVQLKPLSQVCDVNPRFVRNGLEDEDIVSFLPMASVDEIFGKIINMEERSIQEIVKGYTPFKENDVLFAKIIPCMENGKTDKVWFYDMQVDGFSLDDKRVKTPGQNDIPDIIAKWKKRDKKKSSGKGEKWFWVDAKEIRENKYDLSISRYKPVEYEEVSYQSPDQIVKEIKKLENEIIADVEMINGMLRK